MVALTPPPEVQAQFAAAERLTQAGRTAEAAAAYQALLARHPALPEGWYNLAHARRRLGDAAGALAAYAEALRRGIADPQEVHLNRAVILAEDLRETDAARAELLRALELAPAYRPALLNLANLHEDLGEREAARARYLELLGLNPGDVQALARLGQLTGREDAPPLIATIQERLADPGLSFADRASLGFSLARLRDACGEYGPAFQAATAANAASRASVHPPARYDRAAQEALTQALIRAFPAPAPQAADPGPGPQPIFICGMYRSGSTLTEQLLAGHTQVRPGGELTLLPQLIGARVNPFPAAMGRASPTTLEDLAREYRAGLARLFPGALHVTDKRPDNFLLIGLIKRLFPAARIVHTTRDPLDTCLSIFFLHADPQLSYALDLADTGHYFGQYRRLMAHWKSLYGPDILDFNYDALVRDPRTAVGGLLGFLGLPWQESCLDFRERAGAVRTASVWQVREGLYRRSSGRASHYGRELAGLAAELRAFGPG
ncbi:MAG: sulfotransferase [Proteobacteria bacterium]|nr:sulfotransferase [Pseudomonadota bacterium]